MISPPTSHQVCVASGTLGQPTRSYLKKLHELAGLYQDEAAYSQSLAAGREQVVYRVDDRHPDQDAGDVIFGVTWMKPGRIGDEFFMTRGHIHAIANRPEVYYGERGQGVMLMESPEGETRTLEIKPRVICYVPPFWIHRSVNTGDEPLVMTFVYPSDSGQDYGVIEQTGGMKSRVVADGASWKLIRNNSYRPRSPAEIERIYNSGDAQ